MGTNVFDELSYCVCRKVPRKAETIDFLPVAVRKCPLLADADSASQVLLHQHQQRRDFLPAAKPTGLGEHLTPSSVVRTYVVRHFIICGSG